ncbi:uncharacterized protein DSM5745_08362 [Aspergillus mulundensis]|uniref:LysM domain-containing protein n=1 Tax=Aspergillus mulundensis TaxID=1810919 RepID=A0A3D8RAD5_9EURO|nr:hypothetical protein DSM5745_08362 [Aspergillus mulundensis]RDW70851.1 hypothetical protein DSM5745_08362 [Aspergillus mulundensis]
MRLTIITLILGLFALLALGAPSTPSLDAQSDEHSGMTVSDVYWKVQVTPGAPVIILNGTVQSVYAQLLELNPNYDADWNNTDVPFNLEEEEDYEDDEEETTDIDHHVPFNVKHTVDCKGPSGAARTKRIKEGINYLHKVKGQPCSPQTTCGRVSCSYKAAIKWCNWGKGERCLPSFENIAQGASVIVNDCAGVHMDDKLVHGDLHQPDLWSVIVEKDDYKC